MRGMHQEAAAAAVATIWSCARSGPTRIRRNTGMYVLLSVKEAKAEVNCNQSAWAAVEVSG
jgi:hypothetical protein